MKNRRFNVIDEDILLGRCEDAFSDDRISRMWILFWKIEHKEQRDERMKSINTLTVWQEDRDERR
jgi:hypothetical protein